MAFEEEILSPQLIAMALLKLQSNADPNRIINDILKCPVRKEGTLLHKVTQIIGLTQKNIFKKKYKIFKFFQRHTDQIKNALNFISKSSGGDFEIANFTSLQLTQSQHNQNF